MGGAVEDDVAPPEQRLACLGRLERDGLALDASECGDAQVDEFDRRVRRRVAVAHAMSVVKGRGDLVEVDVAADRHVDRVLLADVAHVRRASEVVVLCRDALVME